MRAVSNRVDRNAPGRLLASAVLLFGVWVAYMLLRVDPPRGLHHIVNENHERLAKVVAADALRSRNEASSGRSAPASVAPRLTVIGDGIAGVAAAAGTRLSVDLYGARSYWEELHGVPEVWQTSTSLDSAFSSAGFVKPTSVDGRSPTGASTRLAWIAVENARLKRIEAMQQVDSHFRYRRDGRVRLEPNPSSMSWKVVAGGETKEIPPVSPIVLATGASAQRTVPDIAPNYQAAIHVRHRLLRDKVLIPSDDLFAIPAPLYDFQTVAILGSGGAAWDAALHAIVSGRANLVVVIGSRGPIQQTPAFIELRALHGNKICEVDARLEDIKYAAGDERKVEIWIRDSKGLPELVNNCTNVATQKSQAIARFDRIVEALGRQVGLGTLATIVAAQPNTVKVCTASNGSWIGSKVEFANPQLPPIYVVGAASASLHDGDRSFDLAWDKLLRKDLASDNQHPPVGFAAAALTGTRMGKCFGKDGAFDPKHCNCA